MVTDELKERLAFLAEKYETPEFLEKDPSQFMHRFSGAAEMELVAFTAASLSFGRRDQILSHMEQILAAAGENPVQWVQEEGYRRLFTKGNASFYRVYTHDHMVEFFGALKSILDESGTIGNHVRNLYLREREKCGGAVYLAPLICGLFPRACALVPHGKDSAAKKVNMFLRWMARDSSPVDLGLWNWYPKKNLLVPLDVHVMREATELGLLERTSSGKLQSATMKTALLLAEAAGEVFPSDPARLDFALFGLGVDRQNSSA